MKRHRTLVKLVAVAGVVTLFAAACDDNDDNDTSPVDTTEETVTDDTEDVTEENGDSIADLAVATPELSTLVTALTEADLVDTLDGPGPFTVFAPTDDAFAEIPEETLDEILADPDLLAQILTYHVVDGDFPAADVAELPDVDTGASVMTLEGQDLTIVVNGEGVMVNDAMVVEPDLVASNGVIHIIDTVLLPPGLAL